MVPASTLRHRVVVALVAAALVVLALLPLGGSPGGPGAAEAASGPPDHAKKRAWVNKTLARMSLEERVGQLFMTHAYGETADTQAPADVRANQEAYGVDNAEQLMDKYHLGGIIYFAWSNNVTDPEQIAGLSNGIQDAALAQEPAVPSLVSTDQEGGIVVRVPATELPGNMALGAGRSADDAETAARIGGSELKAVGVNWNFAPVADVNVNPANPVIGVRSFSESPELTAELTAAQVHGYQDEGIAAAAKHFPGHGDTSVDSHTGLPVIDHTREEWETLDRPPFQAAIDEGIQAIMTAHIVVPSLDDSGDPATLSKPIITDLLREEMGYDGVVITDSLAMEGVREKYGDARVPVLALQAGVDMLLMPPQFDLAYTSVLDAVRSGELERSRIDRSVRRILGLKWDLGLVKDPYVDVDRVGDVVGSPEHRQQAQDLTDRTTTLVRNEDGTLPLAADEEHSALVTGWGVSTTRTIADKLGRRGATTQVLETGSDPDEAQIQAAVEAAAQHDVTVVTTNRAWMPATAGQAELVRRLTEAGHPVIAIATRDAYDIAHFPDVPAYLATYSYSTVSLESAVRTIYGEIEPHGQLPVTIPTADDPGSVLYAFGHGLGF